METSNRPLTNQEKMARGSAWMTISNITSRLLGAIYIIPWIAMMGENGNAANGLFNMGYNFYALFLMISSAGIPSAIAKQTAHYNSLNEYGVSRRLFYKALKVMAIFGVVAGGLMYLASPLLADLSGGGEELIPALHSLSAAVIIFPVMAVIRGFFQGNQDMFPFALSQIVEQIARVFYMLLATFIIMQVMNGNYLDAVTQSTFAAFVGMIGSFAVLLYFLQRQKITLDVYVEHSDNQLSISENSLLIQTIKQAVPFIVAGSGITIFKLVDQGTFIRFMGMLTDYSQKELISLFSIFSANPDKLTMVVIALATSLALASLPLITESFTLKSHHELAKLVSNNFQLFAFVMFPSTLGMIALAYPLNTLFYSPDPLGSNVLIEASIVGLVLGLYTMVSSMLQGLYENKLTVKYLLYGLLVKVILQIPMIWLFEVYGPLIATFAGFAVTCYFIVKKIHEVTRFNRLLTLRRMTLITIFTAIMTVAVMLVKHLTYFVLDPSSKVQSLVIILIVAAVGAALYGYMALASGLAEKLLGRNTVSGLKRRLHIK
ncbi:putative polysaccharide biosynthesis protein [Enterococcus sp. HY326]|uniref:putative polysaccharide biosynthesis protein n=1 Tax=Enterococcus sp. HY326 TaxID=2971265 RepID=UPI00223E9710|nr:polysaccharide biosynthesis protein [Enterococcus sp. HY326]